MGNVYDDKENNKENTTKYAALRWELKQRVRGYEVKQYNIIIDALGGWSEDLEAKLKELVPSSVNIHHYSSPFRRIIVNYSIDKRHIESYEHPQIEKFRSGKSVYTIRMVNEEEKYYITIEIESYCKVIIKTWPVYKTVLKVLSVN